MQKLKSKKLSSFQIALISVERLVYPESTLCAYLTNATTLYYPQHHQTPSTNKKICTQIPRSYAFRC